MKRERIGIKPGDYIRSPDRPTARWHRVQRVGQRRNGSRYIVLRRSRIGRLLGLPAKQVLEWSHLRALGYGLKRRTEGAPKIEPERPWEPPFPPGEAMS